MTPRVIRPAHEAQLTHRAFFSDVTAGRLLLSSADGLVTLLDSSDLSVLWKTRLPRLRDLTLSQNGRYVGAVCDSEVWILDTADGRPRHGWEDSVGAIWLADDEEAWTATSRGYEVLLEIRNVEDGQTSWSDLVPDPFGRSSCGFYRTSRSTPPSLWLAAGQDGQQAHWLRRTEDGIRWDPLPPLECTPPAMLADGERCLLIERSDDLVLRHREAGTIIRRLRWQPEDGQLLGVYACPIGPATVLLLSDRGRIHQVDLSGRMADLEIVVAGHEPQVEDDPSGDDLGLLGDVVLLIAVGSGRFISTHSPLGASGDFVALWRWPESG